MKKRIVLFLILLSSIAYAKKITTSNPNDYSVSLLSGKSAFCRGAIIAPSWILTAGHCITTGLNGITNSKIRYKKRVLHKFKFKHGVDIGLIHIQNKAYQKKKAIRLLAKPLLIDYGHLRCQKITHAAHRGTPAIYNLTFRAYSKKMLKTSNPKGIAGSSGSPWIMKTDVGDILVGITHGGGVAPQVAQTKEWINELIHTYTPNEKVKWLKNRDEILIAQ